MKHFESVCVLGGAGLVGYQVCRRLLRDDVTDKVIVVSLGRAEVNEALANLREEFPKAEVIGRYGNVFARGRLGDSETEELEPVRDREDPTRRRGLLSDIYEDFDKATEHSALTRLVCEFQPAGMIDCINTATAISYQDVPTAAKRLMSDIGLRESHEKGEHLQEDVEALLASIEIPQLILHVRLLFAALKQVGTRVYVKVGTTGTGGMGLNIPYTHGEDKPSPVLMAKNAVAFAQTGLLFLSARSEGGPIIKELKPAAMIGYKAVAVQAVPGYVWEKRGDRFVKSRKPTRPLYQAQRATLQEPLDTTPDTERFEIRKGEDGSERTIKLTCVNTGENGWFAHGEFEAITALDQMEIITPEEIARDAVHELVGRSTGRDVIAAVDGAIQGPTYKGGLVRQIALDRITQLMEKESVPSIALGDLGPPQLSKYLFELYMMREVFGELEQTQEGLSNGDAAARLEKLLEDQPDLRDLIISVGIPILLSDGKSIVRGPEIKIPGYDPAAEARVVTQAEIDAWAAKGWVDLREANLKAWSERLGHMLKGRRGGSAGASDAMSHEAYGRDDFRIGEVVAWVFANEPDFRGFRIK